MMMMMMMISYILLIFPALVEQSSREIQVPLSAHVWPLPLLGVGHTASELDPAVRQCAAVPARWTE